MALNAWQKLTRVLPGMPFGTGADGDYSSATAPTLTKDSCSGAAAGTSLTTAGSTFANGDILLIHQTRGTGAGQWEINKVASGGGSANLTLAVALQYTYTDSGASQAQAIKIPMYNDVTVQSGTWTPASWDGNVGGIMTFAAKSLTVTGNISVNGNAGTGWNSASWGGGGVGCGFQGGNSRKSGADELKYSGEGYSAASAQQYTANGNGGGGASVYNSYPSGGGGSYGSDGQDGYTTSGSISGANGLKGSTVGVDTLQSIFFGGGGGAGGRDYDVSIPGTGGAGAGIIMIFTKSMTLSGYLYANGGAGGPSNNGNPNETGGGGGGGAGGAILILSGDASIGTDHITATGGAGGQGHRGYTPYTDGGYGGKGRIAIYHSGTVTGSVGSSYYGTYLDEVDSTLVEGGYLGTPILFGGGLALA